MHSHFIFLMFPLLLCISKVKSFLFLIVVGFFHGLFLWSFLVFDGFLLLFLVLIIPFQKFLKFQHSVFRGQLAFRDLARGLRVILS